MLLGPVWMQASIDNTCMNKWLDRPFSMNQTYLPGATSHADARGRTRYGETNIFSSLTALRVQVVRTALNATGWTRCIDHCGRVGRESRHGNPPCRTESTSSSESYRSVSLGQELSVSHVSGSIPGMCVFRQCSNPSDDLCRSYPPRSAS